MGRRAARREDSAARLRALTRRAYTASSGHLDLDDDVGREFDRIVRGDGGDAEERAPRAPVRRWAVSLRAGLVVLAVVAALTGVVVLRSLAFGSAPIDVPELAAPHSDDDHEHGPADGGETAGSPGGDAAVAPEGGDDREPSGDASAGPVPEVSAPDPRVVVVHVAGAVAAPGVVELPGGARVAQAIEAAGGAAPDAELSAVNLARTVQDGEQVYVPRVGEAPPGAPAGVPASPTGTSTADGGPPDAGVAVDLNTADSAALETLPGVGPAIAQRILDWRTAHGPFHSVDELLEVSGIGPATLERLRERVRV